VPERKSSSLEGLSRGGGGVDEDLEVDYSLNIKEKKVLSNK